MKRHIHDFDGEEHLVLVLECPKDAQESERSQDREAKEDRLDVSFAAERTYGILLASHFNVVWQNCQKIQQTEEGYLQNCTASTLHVAHFQHIRNVSE